VEFLGEGLNNHRLGLCLSVKNHNKNFISKFEDNLGKEFKPIKTPMSKEYHW
jgi:hypothetical protein